MISRKFKIFSLSGFDVSIDISWIFIALLITWSLAVSFFPFNYPGLTAGTYILMAVCAALGFFASIIVHEYCHSIVARHYGMPMKGITLWMLGGVAEMTDEPPNAKTEFLMAVAGPAASIAIAFGCYGLAVLGEQQAWHIVTVGAFDYLWRVNVILILFNLVPAFPLDGGRILRSVLWAWRGRMRWATRVAAKIGGGFGVLLMILGLFALFAGNPIGGLWYFIIGLFIRFAAQASYSQLLIKSGLKDVSVRRFIKNEPVTVPQDETVAELVNDYFYKYQFRLFPVVDAGGKLQGCVRSSAIREIPRDSWGTTRIKEIMRPCDTANTIDADSDAFAALQHMARTKSEQLIAVKDDKIEGVVSQSDILRYVSMFLELAPDGEDDNQFRQQRGMPMARTRPT